MGYKLDYVQVSVDRVNIRLSKASLDVYVCFNQIITVAVAALSALWYGSTT